jgi:uncharacterized protein YjaG (DUF416 family)
LAGDTAAQSFAAHEDVIRARVNGYTPIQRLAFVLALAERWLPAYEKFAAAEEWGDPDLLRRALGACWNHLASQRQSAAQLKHLSDAVLDVSPHMDEFDNAEALQACLLVDTALECCHASDDLSLAVQSAIAGLDTEILVYEFKPMELLERWQKPFVQTEVKNQLALLDEIDSLDACNIEEFRKLIGSRTWAIKWPKREENRVRAAPTRTNQAAFEDYRRFVEKDIQGARPLPARAKYVDKDMHLLMWCGAAWLARYMRRRDIIEGTMGGVLSDKKAKAALIARNQALDAAVNTLPDWPDFLFEIENNALKNQFDMGRIDVRAVTDPHGFGPSLRWLWSEANARGLAGEDAWNHINAWARHRPTAWDQVQSSQGPAGPLQNAMSRSVAWETTNELDHPWEATVDGTRWQVRLNDFPDEVMYSLLIDGEKIDDFHDWPPGWERG